MACFSNVGILYLLRLFAIITKWKANLQYTKNCNNSIKRMNELLNRKKWANGISPPSTNPGVLQKIISINMNISILMDYIQLPIGW